MISGVRELATGRRGPAFCARCGRYRSFEGRSCDGRSSGSWGASAGLLGLVLRPPCRANLPRAERPDCPRGRPTGGSSPGSILHSSPLESALTAGEIESSGPLGEGQGAGGPRRDPYPRRRGTWVAPPRGGTRIMQPGLAVRAPIRSRSGGPRWPHGSLAIRLERLASGETGDRRGSAAGESTAQGSQRGRWRVASRFFLSLFKDGGKESLAPRRRRSSLGGEP
jgi:hypothetical protein